MTLNKSHGGGMLHWLLSLPAQSLIEFQSQTAEWLEEIAPAES